MLLEKIWRESINWKTMLGLTVVSIGHLAYSPLWDTGSYCGHVWNYCRFVYCPQAPSKTKNRIHDVKYSKDAVRLHVCRCIYHVVPERNCHLCMSALREMKTIHREESQVWCAILKQKEIFHLLMLALKLKVLAVVVWVQMNILCLNVLFMCDLMSHEVF